MITKDSYNTRTLFSQNGDILTNDKVNENYRPAKEFCKFKTAIVKLPEKTIYNGESHNNTLGT
mgnify:CR=1 FL=1